MLSYFRDHALFFPIIEGEKVQRVRNYPYPIVTEDSQEILSEDEGEGASSEQAHDQTQVRVVTAEEGAEWRKRMLAEIVCNEGANLL